MKVVLLVLLLAFSCGAISKKKKLDQLKIEILEKPSDGDCEEKSELGNKLTVRIFNNL
jgi:hypothetical protein